MCNVIAGQDPSTYAYKTRSVRLGGHATSIRLEAQFWTILDEIAAEQDMSTPQFLAKLYDEALEIHNAVEYGLAGAIVSEDYRKQRRYRNEAEVGLAYANLPSIGAEVHLPFGGVKRSGSGIPAGKDIIRAVTHRMAWTVNHEDEIEMAQGLSADIFRGDD